MRHKAISRILIHNVHNKRFLLLKCVVTLGFLLLQSWFIMAAGRNSIGEISPFFIGGLLLSAIITGAGTISLLIDINSKNIISRVIQLGASADEWKENVLILTISLYWRAWITFIPVMIIIHIFMLLKALFTLPIFDIQSFVEVVTTSSSTMAFLGFGTVMLLVNIIYVFVAHPVLKKVEKKFYSAKHSMK